MHRCRLDESDRARHGGLPVTTVARILFDLAEAEPYDRLQQAAQEADRLKLPWTGEMGAICERGRGRRALPPIRRLFADLQPPDEGCTPLELRFPPFCRAFGIPSRSRTLTLSEFHGHRAAFEGDRMRDPKLLLAGYRTVRVTHRRLDREAEALADEIKGLLAGIGR